MKREEIKIGESYLIRCACGIFAARCMGVGQATTVMRLKDGNRQLIEKSFHDVICPEPEESLFWPENLNYETREVPPWWQFWKSWP